MPVTIKVAKHEARHFNLQNQKLTSTHQLLTTTLGPDAAEVDKVIQSSVLDSWLEKTSIRPEKNGFVMAAYDAYTNHRNLVIRPEDVWFAVLSQFSFYINKHSEEFRGSFVSHEGKKGLILEQSFSDVGSIDYGSMCENMTRLIEQNIVDPGLRAWVLPNFTTSTQTDRVIASALMMGTLQKYFDYIFDPSTCGIPNVTLLGEIRDYEDILRRISKLNQYGKEPAHFVKLLRPILENMIASFKAPPGDADIVHFWSRIADRHGGSGFDNLSGWITAFCLWDADGKCMSTDQYMDFVPNASPSQDHNRFYEAKILYGVAYHEVDMQLIPAGYITVPVTLNTPKGMLKTKIMAGSVGIICRAFSSTNTFECTSHMNNAQKSQSILHTRSNGSRPDNDAEEPPQKHTFFAVSLARKLANAFRSIRQITTDPTSAPSNLGPSTCGQHKQEGIYPKASKDDNMLEKSEVRSNNVSSVSATYYNQFDTVQASSGWWMYSLKGGLLGMSKEEFIQSKQKEWKGGSSTGRVNLNGEMFVRQDQSEQGFQRIA